MSPKPMTVAEQHRARRRAVQRASDAKLAELARAPIAIQERLRALDRRSAEIRTDAAMGDLDAVRGQTLLIQHDVTRLAALLRETGVRVSV